MKGLILTNAYYDTEEVMYQPLRLKQEFLKLGVETDVLKNDFIPFEINLSKLCPRISGYDFCIYLDKDKYALEAMSALSFAMFNSRYAIETCDDKMKTYLALANSGIALARTLPGPLCFSADARVSAKLFDTVESELGYPLIVKECYGSLGKGVYLVSDRRELESVAESVKCKPHLFQEFIQTSYSKDVRVIVVGGKILGAMLRTSNGDFRSNIGAGGKGTAYEIDAATSQAALKAAKILGLDYCGIDFLFGQNGAPILCEVNSNAFFKSFEQVTGINVAAAYARHVLKSLERAEV